MKLSEVVLQILGILQHHQKFYQILMKNKKVLYITHLSDGPLVKSR